MGKRFEPDRCLQNKNAGIPEIVARFQIGLGSRGIGFLDELLHVPWLHGRFRMFAEDVSISRFRPMRCNAEDGDTALLGFLDGLVHGQLEGRSIGYGLICWCDGQDGVLA